MIDPKKTYKTRDGREVRIYAVDGAAPYAVHGAVLDGCGDWHHENWTIQGDAYYDVAQDDADDLIEVRPRIKREVWVNVYPKCSSIHHSKGEADDVAALHRIACVRLVIDCEEGEGL